MTNIIMTEKATIKAQGTHRHGNCKAVYCIEKMKAYTSMADAAADLGCTQGNVSASITGKSKTCKGLHLCYLNDIDQHLDTMAENYQHLKEQNEELKAELNEFHAWKERQNEEQRQSEERKQIDAEKIHAAMNILAELGASFSA